MQHIFSSRHGSAADAIAAARLLANAVSGSAADSQRMWTGAALDRRRAMLGGWLEERLDEKFPDGGDALPLSGVSINRRRFRGSDAPYYVQVARRAGAGGTGVLMTIAQW